jgi:predicted PurR-regulated permease PerM
MAQNRLQLVFFVLFILLVLVLNFFIFLPYLTILFLALVFAIIFNPLYVRLRKATNKESLAALLSVCIVLLIIVGPISFFGALLFQDASSLYVDLIGITGEEGFNESISSLNSFLTKLFPEQDVRTLEIDIAQYAQSGLSWLLSHLTALFSGVLKVFLGLLLMLLALFYFFRDGKKFVNALARLSPLDDSYDKKITERIEVAVNSVVRGHIIIGILQGTLSGVGFAIFGVPNPVLWAAVAAIASLVPTVGTGLVLIPAILFLFFFESLGAALGLLVWGALAVGLIDNLLGPILIQRGIKIHPFLILLSALGGVILLGPIGFLAGPVLLSLLFALLDLYPKIVSTENSS